MSFPGKVAMEAKDDASAGPVPQLFGPHPNLSDAINRNIIQSEIEGGVQLDDLLEGDVLRVETLSRWYTIVYRGGDRALISGHPTFCPVLTPVRIAGSTWGGSMIKLRYIGRGMRLEFYHPSYRTIITSRINEIRAEPRVSVSSGSVCKPASIA